MPGLLLHQIDDFVENTLKKFDRARWTDISLDLQEYYAMSQMLTDHKKGFDGGEQLQWQVKVQNAPAARNTALYESDNINVIDHIKHAIVPWTFQTTNFAYDVREPAFQSSAERILALLTIRRHSAMCSLAELMEQNFWSAPSDATTQTELLKPYGVPYWIVQNNSADGFAGGAASGHTTVAALSPTTYTNWQNWSQRYTAMTKLDMVKKLREALVKTRFINPVRHRSTQEGRDRHAICTTYTVLSTMEELLEAQNENLGNDIASKDGDVMFRKNPVMWIPYLDANTANHPIYGINWAVFGAVFKRGWYMVNHPPKMAADSHNLREVHFDNSCNFKCSDRRKTFVLHQV